MRIIFLFIILFANNVFSADGICYPQSHIFTGGAPTFAKPQAALFIDNTDESEEDLSIPDEWDWRSVAGVNWLTSVKSQGGCGNCVMHALASVFESQLKIHLGWPWFNPEVSISEGFFCGGGLCNTGWVPQTAVERSLNVGLLDRSCGLNVNSPKECNQNECPNASERRWKLSSYKMVNQGTINIKALRKAILKGPVLSGLTLPSDFSCYGGWGVYKKGPEVPFLNVGHMLAIVGYSKTKKAWIVKNSWGEQWAQKGFGMIYQNDASGFGSQAWSLNFDNQNQIIEIENIKDQDVLKGQSPLKVEFQSKNIKESKTFEPFEIILTENSKTIWSHSCHSLECPITLNTESFSDGTYEIFAKWIKDPKPISMVKSIQIVNTKPQWLPLSNVEIKTLADSSPNEVSFSIPFQVRPNQMKLIFKSKNGEILQEQITQSVPKRMRIALNQNVINTKATHFEVWLSVADYPEFLYFSKKM